MYICIQNKKNNNKKSKLYKAFDKTTFKKHYANHKKYFNAAKSKNYIKLYTEYWKLANKEVHQGYLGVEKAIINHTTAIPEDFLKNCKW